jgi:hypothetical protein
MLHPGLFGRDWSSSSLSQLMLPLLNMRGTGIGCRIVFNYAVTPPTQWTGLCGAPTIAPYCPWQQPVRACRSPRLGMAARLRFQGLPLPALCLRTVPRSKGPVYRLRGRWPFVYVMPQDIAVYHHARCSSLTSWGTFRAVSAVPVRDVLVTAVVLACESCELVRDVSHHRRTSAGRAHRYSVSS